MVDLVVPPELDRLVRKLSNTAGVEKAVGKVIAESKPAAAKPPRYGSLVNTTVRAMPTGFVASSSGVVAKGAEFGGRRKPRKPYATHRRGTVYIVRRRTTMQFLPSNPRGYAITPAMRHSMAGIRQRILDAVFDEVTT